MMKTQISNQDMADLLACAFEGGVNYWIDKIETLMIDKEHFNPGKQYLPSDVVAYGGCIVIRHDTTYRELLCRDDVCRGIVRTMEHMGWNSIDQLMDLHDAEIADMIIQYALFDELVYG